MSSKQTKASNTIVAIITLFLFTLFLGSCGQESNEYDTATTSSEETTDSTLSAPSDLSATAGDSQANLNWSAVTGTSSYTLFRKTSSGVSSSDTSIASISTNSYTHTGLSNGSTYYYKVAAINSSGTGTLSSEVSTTPAADSGGSSAATLSAPANLSATATTGTTSLDWDNVSGATSYTLFWGTSSGITSSNSSITSISTDNYSHTSLSNGSTYYYKVAAIDAAGTGTLSSEVSASPVLSVPTNLSATAGNTQNSLDWDNVSGATSYTLFWGTSSGISSSSTAVTSISSDNYTHSGLTNGNVYYYKVAAVDSSSTGALSAEVSATPANPLVGGSIQSGPLTLSTKVTTFAGIRGSAGSNDSPTATLATFNKIYAMTTDGTNLYIADYGNHKIRQIVISTGEVTTIAGDGNTCSSQANCDGTGTGAKFNQPLGITTDGSNLFVTDSANHTVRKLVLSTGVVTTIAGITGTPGKLDGAGNVATFKKPYGITTDGTKLYVADSHNGLIRTIIIATGVVDTFAGTGSNGSAIDAIGESARFNEPHGITTDGTNIFVADKTNQKIRKIVIATKDVTTIAGSSSGHNDSTTGTDAKFNDPYAITTDGTNLYVADTSNNRIRKIVISNGEVTTIAGMSSSGYLDDDNGTNAKFQGPASITTDGTYLYVGEGSNRIVRRIE